MTLVAEIMWTSYLCLKEVPHIQQGKVPMQNVYISGILAQAI